MYSIVPGKIDVFSYKHNTNKGEVCYKVENYIRVG